MTTMNTRPLIALTHGMGSFESIGDSGVCMFDHIILTMTRIAGSNTENLETLGRSAGKLDDIKDTVKYDDLARYLSKTDG